MYAASNAFATYQQQRVLSANPVELVILLYDGCIKQLKIAALAVEDTEHEKANSSMQKAQRIVTELLNCLDLRFSVAKDLMLLYEFVLNEIASANASKDANHLYEIAEMLNELRSAWVELSKSGIGSIAYSGE